MGGAVQDSYLNYRYLQLLFGGGRSTHWTAPSLDCLLQGFYPPSFTKISAAVREIRFRLGADLVGKRKRQVSSSLHVQDAFLSAFSLNDPEEEKAIQSVENEFSKWFEENGSNQFGKAISVLRNQVDRGLFADGFSRGLARRIVSAAESFNPKLSRKIFLGLPKEKDEVEHKITREEHNHAYIGGYRIDDSVRPFPEEETSSPPPRPPARSCVVYGDKQNPF